MIAAKHTTSTRLVPISVAVIPIAAAIGPAIAEPTGRRTKEPSASYELTRDLDSSGT